MRRREDYTRLVAAALILTIGILVVFQIYLLREPGRIQTVLAADQAEHVANGKTLFAANCVACHGDHGQGGIGPALNTQQFLKNTDDGVITSLIGSGVPGTAMPSWSQAHGGPFTDQQILDLTAFIRSWQATAPAAAVATATPTPSAVEGQAIFSSVCYACHGTNGQGTARAPALNDQKLLAQFDDNWFRQTVADGRPSQGMPTWGKVLSPQQIDAVVAYIRTWQKAPSAASPTSAPTATTAPATPTQAAKPTSAATAAAPGAPTAAATATTAATTAPTAAATATTAPTAAATATTAASGGAPSAADIQAGQGLFASKGCATCHGAQGQGGIGPKLVGITLTHDQIVKQVRTPPPGVMPAFSTGQVSDSELDQIIAFIESLK